MRGFAAVNAVVQAQGSHPIRLVVTDDLRRNRLTVFFRFLLVIPHFIFMYLWGIAAWLVTIVNWFATLFAGHSPRALHDFVTGFVVYQTRVTAYWHLLADPFPPFSAGGTYPVDLQVAPPAHQNRLTVAFRILLAIPPLILAYILQYLFNIFSVVAWIICLFAGKIPEAFQNLGAWVLHFLMQTQAYTLLLTDRYPSFSMEVAVVETAVPTP
jgi:hypothetical protein